MKPAYSKKFTKALLTGLFAGIVTTVLCMIYDIGFRQSTHFAPSDIINVSSLIFFTNLLFLVIGIIYYGFLRIRKGEIIYMILFLALTVMFALMAGNAHRSSVPLLNTQFHELLVVIVVIMGLAAAVGIPLLFHSRKFEEHFL